MSIQRRRWVFVVLLAGAMMMQMGTAVDALAQNLVWSKTYNGAANGFDFGYGAAVASDGSVYVNGGTYVTGQDNNFLLRKYSAAGSVLWSKSFNGAANGNDSGSGVAVASDGSVYAAGSTFVARQGYNLLLRKYSASGAVLWSKTYNGAANGNDGGAGVAVASDGSVYVTGNTYVTGQGNHLLLQKYSANGAVLWSKSSRAADVNDNLYGVAVAPDGSVYTAGRIVVKGQSCNLLLRKYSAAGAILWSKTYNGAANGWDDGYAVAVARDGSVYVTGQTFVTGQGYNLLLRKYSAAGAVLWSKSSRATGGNDVGFGVAVASDGSVYVNGGTYVTGQIINLLLRKYSAAGAVLWSRSFNGAANGIDYGVGVAVASDGSAYATGYTSVTGQDFNLLLRKYK